MTTSGAGEHGEGTGLGDLSTEDLAHRLLTDTDAAAAVLERLVAEEDQLVLDNRMKPYLDKVPQVLGSFPPRWPAASWIGSSPTP